jgi:protein-glutamine gamma-glutamyltransferase
MTIATTDQHGALHKASVWLLATAAVTLAPHGMHLPSWLLIVCSLLLIWRALALRRPPIAMPRSLPYRAAIILIALTAAAGVRYHFGHFFGKEPGVALLTLLLCLKQFETSSGRDIRVAVLLSFFLQLGLFLYNQTLPIALLAFGGTFLATVTLLTLVVPTVSMQRTLRTAAVLMLQALPFLLVLFLLFPRIPGPLWGLPADAHSGVSGLSDTMEPGSISALGLSDAVAFRAQFPGTPPPPEQRYWRGPVLSLFDGRTWRPATPAVAERPSYTPSGPSFAYTLTLEPHNRRWLLGLEFPGGGVPRARYTSDYQILAERPVRARTRTELRAYPETAVGLYEDRDVLNGARALPARSNPRARDLARTLTGPGMSDALIVARVIEHVRQLELTYTLRPPLMGSDAIDEFLFDHQRGFCEHFASAFVFLIRAAGVPARVVTGYQGGEINPVDGTLVVRQSDAHAWAEVWLPDEGWRRVDPTALAAPLRIESGLSAALPRGEPLPLMMRPAMAWLRELRHRWDALSNAWNQAVIGFDGERQRQFIERLGLSNPDWKTLAALLGGSIGVLMLVLYGWAFIQRRTEDPLDLAWVAFCTKLAHAGLVRLPWEGPMHYADRAADAHPASAAQVREIALRYARLRYGSKHDPAREDVRQLAQRIRKLNIK